MEKRIELEKRRLSAAEVVELNLDNCRSTTIEGLTSEFVNLKNLSLIGVGLTSLKGFPKLPSLEKLELSENRISGGLQALCILTSLKSLNLSSNKLADFDVLLPLKEISTLKSLDVQGNDVACKIEYFDVIWAMLPSLKYLDGVDRYERDTDSEGDVNGEDSDCDSVTVNGVNPKYVISDGDDDDGEEEDEDNEEETTGKVGAKPDEEVSTDDSEEGSGQVIDDEEDDSDSGEDSEVDVPEGYEVQNIPLSDLYSDLKTLESGSDFEVQGADSSEDEVSEDNVSLVEEAPVLQDAGEEECAETKRGLKRPHEEDESS